MEERSAWSHTDGHEQALSYEGKCAIQNSDRLRRPMKVFLQNESTLAFVKKAGVWTPDAAQAMLFSDTNSAIEFCLEHELENMQIVLNFAEFGYDVRLPVKMPHGATRVSI